MSGPPEGRRKPVDLEPEEFARLGHRLVDDVAELLRTMRDRPLTAGETPQEIRAVLGADRPLPQHVSDPGEVLAEATKLLFEHSLFNGHPRFFGYITAGAAPLGMLGDLLAAAVNPNVGAAALAPMAGEMEAQAVRWIAELIGFPPGGGGVLVSGGNVANMLGFWAARATVKGWDLREDGMHADGSRSLRVYGSAGTHTWIQKAADLAGLGTSSIRWIVTDARGVIDVGALRRAIEQDVAAGDVPLMVVGTAGSVSTGVVDPLAELREVCDEHATWLHVDGAYGAFAAAAPNAPEDLRAVALADSVALDPHKWLYAPLEAGCTLVRRPDALLAAFSYRPEYYHFQEEARNYFEHGLQNSRGFRALKVWLLLRQLGRDAYARMIGEDIELARRFHEIADERSELEALTHGLSITTYRYVPTDLAERRAEPEVAEYLNALNEAVQDRMERSGRAFVSNAVLDGVYALRMCIVNFRTTLADVVALADITEELGRAADREMRPAALA
ncbi:MAG TPA: aminotransferase class V-fold PLP-dependent enzyme [Longimicrobiales bacterium]|nr:aminotransferase class V-fold PLP-dependent enzyme [Longimicrobiales bacterium]